MATRKNAAKKVVAKKATKKAENLDRLKNRNQPSKRVTKRKPKAVPSVEVDALVNEQADSVNVATDSVEAYSDEAIQGELHMLEQQRLWNRAEFINIEQLPTAARMGVAQFLFNQGAKFINGNELVSVDNICFISTLLSPRIHAIRLLGNDVVELVLGTDPRLKESKAIVSMDSISVGIRTGLVWKGDNLPEDVEIGGAHYVRVS